jgi:hypothetical protein
MHKSIILLLGLLVVLLPFGSSNLSNANAIADFDKGDRKQVSVSSLKCNNINVNLNGLELDVFPPFLTNSGLAAEAADDNNEPSSFAANNEGSTVNDFRFICINNNNNTVNEEGPTTASLTVKKQVFGCDNTSELPLFMDCQDLQNNSPEWLDCNNSNITTSIFCQSLPESIFDIEVNASNGQQISQFEGSTEGTTIQNLEPGTYTVNEIKNPTFAVEQLIEDADAEQACVNVAGFSDGGELQKGNFVIVYREICFEYVDELGNDCNNITLAAGEHRTCTVKNYIALVNENTG